MPRTVTVGSLFSGIGGLDLGLERAGMEVRWQCEIDPYCRKVLAKHWPDIPCYEDVRNLPDDIEPVDLVCGGYPCQPFSLAGGRQGTDDPRHLWPAFCDTLRVLRPRFALLENVPGHLSLGFDGVLADLASLGYDTEWTCIPAAAVGAPHLRWRLFVVAYANEQGEPGQSLDAFAGPRIVVSDAQRAGLRDEPEPECRCGGTTIADDDGTERTVADAAGDPRWLCDGDGQEDVPDADEERRGGGTGIFGTPGRGQFADGGQWTTEPDVGRVAHGVPSRVDRLRALGNAVVPQVAEFIGRRLMEQIERVNA